MKHRRLDLLSRTYSYVQRYRNILLVLLKYGFDDLIDSLKIEQYVNIRIFFGKRRSDRLHAMSRAQRVRAVLEELGPTFIKLGQAFSTRADLLPADILQELTLLQDRVPAFPTDTARHIISTELRKPWHDVFAELEPTPLAAGSIGQVYEAKLWSGERVAVKVQRPKLRDQISVDLEIIHHMAMLMERAFELQVQKPSRIVDEFERTIFQELDYTIEAGNMERFESIFHEEPYLYVPKVYREWTTERVLVLEFVEGIKPSKRDQLIMAGLDPVEIAKHGSEFLLRQIFAEGFFHADPHPGNIQVMDGNKLCFLDFGMMGRIDRQSREIFATLVYRIIQRDEAKVAEALLQLTHGHALVNRQNLERQISELIDQYLYRPLKQIRVAKLIRQILELTVANDLRIPTHFFLLIKSISQIENLGRTLDPDFNLTERAEPHIRKILIDRYHPKRFARDFYDTGLDLIYLVKDVPGEIRELLKQAKQGNVQLEMKHQGLQPLKQTLDSVSSRISSAIVLAALIVGSSLIVQSGVPPLWHEIPIIGLAGYLASGVMGIFLLRAIAKGR